MATEKIEIQILANGKPATAAIGKVDRKTKQLGTTTQRTSAMMTKSWAKVGIAIAAVTVVLKKSIDAHGIQLKAELALTNALRLNAKAGDDTAEMWFKYASALQEVTLFGDEATLQQIAMLKTMGLTDDMTRKIIETAQDYATAFNKDFSSSVRELSMTLSGQMGTIKRSVSTIGEYTKEQMKAGAVIDFVAKVTKGQAKALADTPWGKTKQLANDFGDELENLGKTILSTFSEGGGFKALQEFVKAVKIGFETLVKGAKIVQDINVLAQANVDMAITKELLKERIKLEEKLVSITSDSWFASQRRKKTEEELVAVNANLSKMQAKSLVTIRKILDAEESITDEKDKQRGIVNDPQLNEFESLKKGFFSTTKTVKEEMKEWETAGAGVADKLADGFSQIAVGAKFSFKDMTRSILADLAKIAIKQAIVGAISSAAGFFGFHKGTTEVKHTGGVIGSIPSFHSGMASDERIAKLQVGEAVINRTGARRNSEAIDAMNRGMPVGGGDSTVVHVTYSPQVNALDPRTAQAVIAENAPTVVSIIRQAFNKTGQQVNI